MKYNIYLVAGIILFNSCGNESKPQITAPQKSIQETVSSEVRKDSLFDQLVTGPKSNLAVAKLLAPEIKEQHFDTAGVSVSDFIRENNHFRASLRRFYAYGDGFYDYKNGLVINSLMSQDSSFSGAKSEQDINQNIEIIAYERSKILNKIEETYLKNIKKIGKSLALDILSSSSQTERIKKLVKNKSKAKAIEWLTQNSELISKVNDELKHSGLTLEQQEVTTIIGSVSIGVYQLVKDDPTLLSVKHYVKEAKKVYTDYRQIYTLVKSINDYQKNIVVETTNVFESINRAQRAMNSDIKDINHDLVTDPQFKKKYFDAIYDRVVKGKKTNESGDSLLEEKFSFIDQNVVSAFDSASKIASNVNSITNASMLIADKFGIELPKDIQNIAVKAQQISSTINLASSVLSGLSSGGLMGGISALTSSAGLKALGIAPNSAFHQEVLSKLGVIDQKVDRVIDNQKIILEAQKDTMGMIRNLAIMVDEYHAKEMAKLQEIRSIVTINQRILQRNFNDGIISCENEIASVLDKRAGVDEKIDFSDYNHFSSMLRGYKNIKHYYDIDSAKNIDSCLLSLSKTFSVLDPKESLLRVFYNSKDGTDLLIKANYLPLVEQVKKKFGKKSYTSYPLDIPISNFDTFDRYKKERTLINISEKNSSRFQLNYFISSSAVLRYTASLLAFYPLLEANLNFERETRTNDFIRNYLTRDLTQKGAGYKALEGALHYLRSAIAQEALLAGEPILDQALINNGEFLENTGIDYCSSALVSNKDCAFSSNSLLMTNFLNYYLSNKLNTEKKRELYSNYRSNLDISGIKSLLENSSISLEVINNDRLVIRFLDSSTQNKGIIELPALKEISSKRVVYSKNMFNLVRAYHRVIDALVTISPYDYAGLNKEYAVELIRI